ncbi:MAG TPA: response regulator transcription factor [Clostridia bacterium]|nr:response regulator transcription factor [Clostridia bacterium]
MAGKKQTNQVSTCVLSDHPVVIEQLNRALAKMPGIELQHRLLDWSQSGDDSGMPLPRATTYVMDARDQGKGKQLCGRILELHPKARILIVSEKLAEPQAFALLRLGVKGLLSYDEIDGQLRRAVKAVAEGGYWVPRAVLSRFVESILDVAAEVKNYNLPAKLSRRERDVLDALLKNESNKEIANHLNISERTVKFHVSNLLNKYSVRRRADLIVLWLHDSSAHANAVPAVH